MRDKTFLAISNSGIARAECMKNEWQIEHLLVDRDVRCLASDPLAANVAYVGTQGHGVYRSDDRGKTWQSAGMEGQIVKSLAVSPHERGTIYAGTKPACVFVTRDSGKTWNELETFRHIRGRRFWFSPAEKPGTAYVQDMSISPTDPNVLMAGVEFGAVIRSEDGGQTWSNHINGSLRDCHDLTFHANNGNWVYEAGGTGGGASFSRDGGRTWRKAKAGLVKNYGVACAADPAKPEVWYVAVAPSPMNAFGDKPEAYLYRASGGADWQAIGWEAHPMHEMPTVLVTDRSAPGHLYAGIAKGNVWHSTDYGDSWNKLPFNLNGVWFSMLVL